MSLHDRLKFNRKKRNKITDKNINFLSFKKWLKDGGAEFPNLYFKKYSDNERGVHSNKNIKNDTEIMYIPHHLLITDELDCNLSRDLGNDLFSMTNTNLLKIAMYILETIEDDDNFYQPYYSILPDDIGHLPIFWDDSTLKLLENSDFLEDIASRKKMLTKEYNEIASKSKLFKNTISLNDWMWVRSIVGSRNFSVNVNGIQHSAMVPLADMLNHIRPAETLWGYDNAKRGFTMTSLTDIKPHAQIMDSYGRKSNRKYLLHYGFVMDNNIEKNNMCDDDVCIEFDFPGYSPTVNNYLLNRHQKLYVTKDNFMAKILPLMRKLNMNDEELKKYGENASCNTIVCKRNELAALVSISNLIRNRLKKYPKTYYENLSTLKKLKGFSKERNAVNFVKKQKELLLLIKSMADTMIPYVINDTIPESNQIHSDYKMYLNYN